MNENNSLHGLTLFLSVVIMILIAQLVSMNKKISAYKDCVNSYEVVERKYIDTIEWAYDYLTSGGAQKQRDAIDELDINTQKVSCTIP